MTSPVISAVLTGAELKTGVALWAVEWVAVWVAVWAASRIGVAELGDAATVTTVAVARLAAVPASASVRLVLEPWCLRMVPLQCVGVRINP